MRTSHIFGCVVLIDNGHCFPWKNTTYRCVHCCAEADGNGGVDNVGRKAALRVMPSLDAHYRMLFVFALFMNESG